MILSALAMASMLRAGGAVQRPGDILTKLPPYNQRAEQGDFAIGPNYSNAPELTARDNVPKGRVFKFTMLSTESLMYPGISKTAPAGEIVPYQRKVSVYVPSQYASGSAAPYLITQDSMGQGILPTILDNMIADHRLPTMVAIMIDSGGSDSKGSERGLEYDTLSGGYAEFVEAEVLPRVEQECGVKLSKDPNARMTMGGSSGGACAFTMAWYRPDLYHRVVTYSGTYVNQQWPPNPQTPHGAWEYHEHLIAAAKRKPLRVWMEVGENDFRNDEPEATYHNWVMANQRMAQVLRAKGYPYQFLFARNAGHVDYKVLCQTLPQALEWVWKGYRAKS